MHFNLGYQTLSVAVTNFRTLSSPLSMYHRTSMNFGFLGRIVSSAPHKQHKKGGIPSSTTGHQPSFVTYIAILSPATNAALQGTIIFCSSPPHSPTSSLLHRRTSFLTLLPRGQSYDGTPLSRLLKRHGHKSRSSHGADAPAPVCAPSKRESPPRACAPFPPPRWLVRGCSLLQRCEQLVVSVGPVRCRGRPPPRQMPLPSS